MNFIKKELASLEAEIFDQIDYSELSKPSSINVYRDVFKDKPYYVALVNPVSLKILYFCDQGLAYLGRENLDFSATNISFISTILSMDNSHIFSYGVQHFLKANNDYLSLSYKVKRHDGEWRWMYSVSKLLNKKASKFGFVTLTLLFDVEDQYNLNHLNTSRTQFQMALENDELYKLSTLSNREKEIIRKFSHDLKSSEIAEFFHISTNTLQSHLKSIKRKLQIRSNVQLYKYASYLNRFEID